MKKMVILFLILFISGCTCQTNPEKDKLAQCLTDKGAVIYVKTGCAACGMQKDMFGCSFDKLTSINCMDNPIICVDKNIETVPTWEINGETYIGARALEQLAHLAGCEYLNSN